MSIKTFTQDPTDLLDYVGDYSAWVGTDTISSVTVVADTGLTISSVSNDDSSVTFWASGGVNGTSYNVVVKVTTAAGRVLERTLMFTIVNQ